MTATTRRLSLLLAALVLLPTLVAGTLPALAAPGGKDGKTSKTSKTGKKTTPSGPSPYSATKVLQRVFRNADGSTSEFQANTVTVSVDQTRNLRGRQRVLVSWSGAQPSGGRAVNPYGGAGLQQEYPVMVLQCRGTDDASLPAEQQLRPETCFTSTVIERSQITRSDGEAPWRNDLDASDAEKARLTGPTPFPSAETCPVADFDPLSTHLTPFVAADGKVYPACSADTMPPEAAVDAAFPPNEIAGFTDQDGNGSVRFEVRSDVENESLGCSDTVACSIVVIPINGLSCASPPAASDPTVMPSTEPTDGPTEPTDTSSPTDGPTDGPTDEPTDGATGGPTDTPTDTPSDTPSDGEPTPTGNPSPTSSSAPVPDSDPAQWASSCRKGGTFEPGSSNFTARGADLAASPSLWWAPSIWKNRFSVPVTFGLPPDACDVLDPRPPTGFYGSELLAQAALQWAPAYCLDKKRFKFQLNQMSDEAGFKLMETGVGPAAVVSSKHKVTGDSPVGYAPTAVTGFGIGYTIDLPDNQGEYTNLRLNARLLAKLLTQSYLGSSLGNTHPGIETNPLSIQTDPEFIALNPGLSQIETEAGATLLSLSNASDVIDQLTAYVAADKDAAAFVKGAADPWGMRVNPSYRKLKLPRDEFPLLDTFVPVTDDPCRNANPSPYFTQIAAPVTSLRKISDALLDGHPNVQTKCTVDATGGSRLGRVDRQNYGTRLMLGVVSLGDQQRFGLRSAALQTAPGSFVAPSATSLGAALKLMKQGKKKGRTDTKGPFVLDQRDVRKSRSAYPGTMVVYTAAKTKGLDPEAAEDVALFMRTSTTEGQVQGSGNGELPEGFLPIRRSGSTAALFATARRVATAVEKGAATTEETDGEDGQDGEDSDTGTSTVLPPPATVDEIPTEAGEPTDVDGVDGELPATDPVAMPRTAGLSSGLASKLLPLLLLLGMLGLGGALGTRFFVRPPRGGGS